MIEGWRLLPWLQEAARRDLGAVKTYVDCDACMKNLSPEIRRSMACGWLSPAPAGHAVRAWTPVGRKGDDPTTCVGYTTKLPEVVEVNLARFHHDKGALDAFCGGEQPTELLLRGIEILTSEASAVTEYYMTPQSKGGGAEG